MTKKSDTLKEALRTAQEQTVLNIIYPDNTEEEKKGLKTKRVTILVTEETFSYLKERAYKENESMGSIIGSLIEKDRAEHDS